jgi:uncharacterized membrane protein YphA (DoxX/SURF4 family)
MDKVSNTTSNKTKLREYAPSVTRIALALVFLWFGLNQIFNGPSFYGFIPSWAYFVPVQTTVLLNGIFETVFGLLLILGLFTRISAGLLALHLFGIAFSLGYNDIMIRDIGLALAATSIVLHGDDKLSIRRLFGSKIT